jgi:UDP-N-acetylglucosamine 3-dehydrogenase
MLFSMLKVGILGAGGMGKVHARHYSRMNDVSLLFWERDPERAEDYEKRFEVTKVSSYDELLSKADIIDICLPTDLHLEHGLKAMSSGKAVFIEKPVAGSFEDAMKLHEAAEKAGVVYQPGQVVRFFPEFATGARLVREGKLGTPGAARVHRGGFAPVGSDSWFLDHSRSGGVLLDLAIHDFDFLRWTFGEVDRLTSRSVGAKIGHGPDYALTVLHFKSGVVAHVESTWMDPIGFRTTFELSGSKGTIEFDSRKAANLKAHFTGKTFFESPLNADDDPYFRQLTSFLNAVKTNSKPEVTGLDGAMAVAISHAALESARSLKAIVPPSA